MSETFGSETMPMQASDAPVIAPPGNQGLAVPKVQGWAWGLASRAAIIYALPSVLNILHLEYLHVHPGQMWDLAYPFFLHHILGRSKPSFYVDVRDHFVYDILFALLLGVVWLLIDRKRKHETVLFEASRLVCRYGLAHMLFGYGNEKFFGDQGGWSLEPPLLVKSFGEINGFTAMMSWLSFSTLYAWFAGWAEAGAGALMFFRRFTTLAALLTLADMGMVWLINQSYWDHWGSAAFSPLHFAPMALFLVAPEVPRLVNFFLLNRPAVTQFNCLTRPRWFRRLALAAKIVFVPLVIYWEVISNIGDGMAVHTFSPLRGIYAVQSFERNDVNEPLSADYPDRWSEVAFSALGFPGGEGDIFIRTEGDRFVSLDVFWPQLGPDEPETYTLLARARNAKRRVQMTAVAAGDLPIHAIVLVQRADLWIGAPRKSGDLGSLHYVRSGSGIVTLEGTVDGQKLKMTLRREDLDSMPYFRYRWKPI